MKRISSMQHNKDLCKNPQQKCLCYGDRDDISVQTLPEFSRLFGRQKLVDSHIEIKKGFCKHDLNFMVINSLTIAYLSNPCT